MEEDRRRGNFVNGSYFWATDCVIIKEISQEACELVVNVLLERNHFFEAFTDITDGMRDVDE